MKCQSLYLTFCPPILSAEVVLHVDPGPAEPGYALPLQTVLIQISWLLQKPT